MSQLLIKAIVLALATFSLGGLAAKAADESPVVPVTRADLKRTLEDSKRSAPRLPLPPLSAEEREKAGGGDWSIVNNGRMRKYYLPPELTASGLSREPDGGMSLGHPFQTMIFWLVSRANNCTYCMGHQESKLAAAGVAEDTVAALDGDWSEFSPAERAAFGLARKLTFEPHAIESDDLDRLRAFYNDKQILEILFVTGNFNAMNRWTGALKIPQEEHRVYLTPTAARFQTLRSGIAPLPSGASTPVCAAPAKRPALESRDEVEAALRAARARSPRLPLASESETRLALAGAPSIAEAPGSGPLPQWARLLANFPRAGIGRVGVHLAASTRGTLEPRLRAEIAWVAARHDRAWYALDQAGSKLRALGLSEGAIFALGTGAESSETPAARAALAFARKLTVDPALINDADVAGLRAEYSDKAVAEIIWHVTEAAFFDRVTEAAGLAVGE